MERDTPGQLLSHLSGSAPGKLHQNLGLFKPGKQIVLVIWQWKQTYLNILISSEDWHLVGQRHGGADPCVYPARLFGGQGSSEFRSGSGFG